MTLPTQGDTVNPDRVVTDRLARFARSRDPRDRWPTLADGAWARARREIASVVRAVLADATPTPLAARGDDDVYAFKVAAYTTGTGALLGRWVADGRVRAAPEISAMVAHELNQGRRRAARMEREVMPAIDALLAHGITPVVLKGFHTARAYFEEPGLRPSADVDVIVPPAQLGLAESALSAAAFGASPKRTYDPYEAHWQGVGVDGRIFSLDGIDERNRWVIDLHDSFGRLIGAQNVRLDDDLRYVVPFEIAGRRLLAPAQPLLVVYLACQISVDLQSMRLMRLVELVRVIRADSANGTLDWGEVTGLMRRTGSSHFAHVALSLVEQLAPGTVAPSALSQAHAASNWAIRRTAPRLTPEGNGAVRTSVMLHLMWVRSPLDAIRLLVLLLTESAPFSARRVLIRCVSLARRVVGGTVSFRPDESRT